MKTKIFPLIFFFFCFIACEPPVTFSEPQPSAKRNIIRFPTKLVGSYKSEDGLSTIHIDESTISRIYDFDFTIHQNELDSTDSIIGDTLLIDIQTNEEVPISRIGDSLVVHFYNVDTIFRIDESHVVRKFKGHYFLSSRFNETAWQVQKLSFKNEFLELSKISSKYEVENLKELTDHNQDTLSFKHLKPSKRQFKRFVKQGGFKNKELFRKQ